MAEKRVVGKAIGDAELTDRWVILKESFFKDEYKKDRELYPYFCTGGFGCTAGLLGSKVFGHFVNEIPGEGSQIRREYIERFATEDEVRDAATILICRNVGEGI
jgi:hypothetical protein